MNTKQEFEDLIIRIMNERFNWDEDFASVAAQTVHRDVVRWMNDNQIVFYQP